MDRVPHGKALFWATTGVFLVLAAVPSAILLEKAGEYARFLSAWDPGALRGLKSRTIPHGGGPAGAAEDPSIRFVEFSIEARQASRVELAGDFNRWRPESLPLTRGRKGRWEVLVPLPPGRHRYVFRVDGRWTPDPAAPATARWEDVPVSVREVR